jgi:hypothetical protein
MTDIFHQEANAPIEMALPEAALPKPVGSDWSPTTESAAERDGKTAGKVNNERRDALKNARAKVEAKGYQTRQERLDKANKSYDRDTGSRRERESTKGAVARAIEKSGYAPSRDEANSGRSELRTAVETLAQRYPGKKASDFVATAKQWDAEYCRDPVGTREKILETYAAVSPSNFRDAVQSEKGHGVRGALQQARRDQEIASDLAAFEKEFGNKLPGVLSELVKHDADLVNDPAGTSARLAANYGAPVTLAQQAAYEAKQHQERARQQDAANVNKALDMFIQRGIGDEAMMHEIADVLESKTFSRSNDKGDNFKRAYHQVVAQRANKAGNRYAKGNATKSIHGAPSAAHEATRSAGTGGVRDSIGRARGRA